MLENERGQRVPVRCWARRPPPDVLAQLLSVARQPWALHRVAAMPDAHVASGVVTPLLRLEPMAVLKG